MNNIRYQTFFVFFKEWRFNQHLYGHVIAKAKLPHVGTRTFYLLVTFREGDLRLIMLLR